MQVQADARSRLGGSAAAASSVVAADLQSALEPESLLLASDEDLQHEKLSQLPSAEDLLREDALLERSRELRLARRTAKQPMDVAAMMVDSQKTMMEAIGHLFRQERK